MTVLRGRFEKIVSDSTLAIDGGPKVRIAPFPKRNLFDDREKLAVMGLFDDAVDQGHSVLGYNGAQEEGYCCEFARFMGGGYADGVNSGTNAVYVALRALEIEPFTEVIVPAVTDSGGVMPVALNNCIPVPADCAPGSFNVGPDQIAERITERTSAIIVAHIAGFACDMEPIMALAREKNIPVIEDCAQAHGVRYKEKNVGTFGDIASFSTMFGKHHCTGGQGGVVFTQNEDLYWSIRRHADRGKPFGVNADNSDVAALNCNMDEIHATIGRVQLKKLPGIIRRRRDLTRMVREQMSQAGLQVVQLVEPNDDVQAVCWFWLFHLEPSLLSVDKAAFAEAVAAEGIPAEDSYLPMPTRGDWYRGRKVFGNSGYPWACPQYAGQTSPSYELPNILATDACHFRVSFHEDWTSREVENLIAALTKVEQVYRQR